MFVSRNHKQLTNKLDQFYIIAALCSINNNHTFIVYTKNCTKGFTHTQQNENLFFYNY